MFLLSSIKTRHVAVGTMGRGATVAEAANVRENDTLMHVAIPASPHSPNGTGDTSSLIVLRVDYSSFDNSPKRSQLHRNCVGCVSPCEAIGIRILCALARKMPRMLFLAAMSRWTTNRDTAPFSAVVNVRLVPGSPAEHIDEFFCKIQILILSSL